MSSKNIRLVLTAIAKLKDAAEICVEAQRIVSTVSVSSQSASMIEEAIEMTSCAAEFLLIDIAKERIQDGASEQRQ